MDCTLYSLMEATESFEVINRTPPQNYIFNVYRLSQKTLDKGYVRCCLEWKETFALL
jgi:hypothetical protein